ncbi:MAG: phytoene desaturase family protein [Anaerolineae bacterium]
MKKVLVIGAGIGGIATAARLAKIGYDVTVLEKTAAPGGRVALLERDGYRFDMGATLFLMPETYAQTYADLDERMEDHLDLRRVEPNYRVHFHDDSYLDITPNLVEMREQLEAMEPGSFQSLLDFMEEGYRHYYLSLEKFVGRNFYTAFDFFAPKHLPLLWKLKPLGKHINVIKKHFKDPRLRAAFSFQNMYLGLSPYDAPATYTLLQFTELAEGVWYPMGGLYRVVESLIEIAEGFGAKFHYDAPVKQINVDGDRATGVTLEDGETLRADLVVANADVPYVYAELLPENPVARRLHNKKYTSSAIMFYWGVAGDRSDALLHHNAFLADHKYRRSFEQIFDEYTMPDEPSFYVNAVTRTDPGMAPEDGDAIMVLVPVGCLDEKTPQDWDAMRDRARDWIIENLEKIGVEKLRERIRFEETLMPPDYKNIWNLARGTAFGLSHNVLQVGYLRPQNRHRRYGNLYFVGASTHPGTGVPIVLISAALVEQRIQKEHPVAAQINTVR